MLFQTYKCSITVADIETMPVPIQGPILYEDLGNGKRRKVQTTVKTELHIPVAIAYKVASKVPGYDLPIAWHFGEGCLDEFIQTLFKLFDWAQSLLQCNHPMIKPDVATMAALDAAPDCHICQRPLDHTDKHLDHDHISGKVNILKEKF